MSNYTFLPKPLNAAWKKATDLNDEDELEKEEAQFEEELKQYFFPGNQHEYDPDGH